ncbi:MAG: hypothetical protein IKS48_06905 [Eubacterium sp.]|nr:hypothetical protein [Eubacterium sp.]
MKVRKCIAASLCVALVLMTAGCSGTASNSSTGTESGTMAEISSVSETTEMTEAITENSTENADKSFRADNSFIDEYPSFTLTSDNLHDGVWDDVISYTDKGENRSPQLSWEPVDGAGQYLIYMSDLGAWNWIHWKSENVTETTLPEGWASTSEYKGPYPPNGSTHTYEIYVVAVKKPIERMKGGFDGQNPKFEECFKAADIDIDGNEGNIISCGKLSGTFTH